jgi:hypothetical protein
MSTTQELVRPPAVAGTFYPARPDVLAADVDGYLGAAAVAGLTPKALIVPHAGYVYSGPIAGSAYATFAGSVPERGAADEVRRVVLLGPAHYVPVEGIAVLSVDAFATPLGTVPIDAAARALVLALPGVRIDDAAHEPEHSLEVQLPFLQRTLRAFTLLPLLVGRADPGLVTRVLDAVWGGPETLVVVSTDLSHYLAYDHARDRDARTASAIVHCDGAAVDDYDACGATPLRGLLTVARARALGVRALDVRNSGDTAGDRTRVVGYGAFALEER